ncbi:MAG: aminoacetone oxidase family FAD-binding enzyme [Bacilli bacterium]|jgi:predicted Rossmann fold flavoprotein|nr:aminoacetone oxidase family FAD-binding enzyme [Bacilli bacterium]
MIYNTIINGGGVSGLMCAYQLAQSKVDFLLIEKKESLGKKLLLTGGTRCNVTNNLDVDTFIQNLTLPHKRFLYSLLKDFGPSDILKFFSGNNCPLVLENDLKYFPKSNRSQDVLEVFLKKIPQHQIKLNTAVSKIYKHEDIFIVECSNKEYKAKNVVIASGSKSYPHTGSTGDGLKFARDLEIEFTEFTPAETHIYSRQVVKEFDTLQGSSLKDIIVKIKGTNKKSQGDVLFTHFGLSGPAILHLSEDIYDSMQKQKVILQLPLGSLSRSEIDDVFNISRSKNMTILKTLEQCTTKRIASLLLEKLQIENKRINEISKNLIQKLIDALLGYEITVDRVQDVSKAFVNKGGISTEELSPKTMEVKRIANLYFIGETVDLHGPIGGYNITIALSTAVAAAKDIISKS